MVDAWINSFYQIINNFGFPDPIHAALVHMPIGLAAGAFFFAWTAFLFKREKLAVTAYHCIALTVLFLFPVVLFGVMDWRHFFGGAWLFPIKWKMILAGILLVISSIALVLGFRGKEKSKTALLFYTLCFVVVILLGWFGARLVYGEKSQGELKTYQAGGKIFAANCNACHANGGNLILPDKPLRNSPDLKDIKTFLQQIRHPDAPMPTFNQSRISDNEAKDLYDYIVNELNFPKARNNAR